jgi:hypothetical protein
VGAWAVEVDVELQWSLCRGSDPQERNHQSQGRRTVGGVRAPTWRPWTGRLWLLRRKEKGGEPGTCVTRRGRWSTDLTGEASCTEEAKED